MIGLVLVFILGCQTSQEVQWRNDLFERITPSPVGGGFEMEGYWVGGSLVVKDDTDGRYHMFVSRWPNARPLHPG